MRGTRFFKAGSIVLYSVTIMWYIRSLWSVKERDKVTPPAGPTRTALPTPSPLVAPPPAAAPLTLEAPLTPAPHCFYVFMLHVVGLPPQTSQVKYVNHPTGTYPP